ncbi:uncharacterized protein LOC107044790 [Diachasma alloeum]|uniref:uncharacterized protein LOC107044790 n=1 Tax=Diachasma alloeum TaxID=454923 RepID=UPI0007384DB9|nr:uncharacterized protein LOC107044790 [Diachasma alloeum]
MPASAESLKRKRRCFKAKLTKLNNWLKGEDVKTALLETLDMKLVDLIAKYSEWESDQTHLLLLDAAHEEEHFNEGENIMESYFKTADELKNIINQRSAQSTSSARPNNSHDSEDRLHSTTAKLPELTLSKFDGSFEKFRSFCDEFKAAIHDNRKIQKVTKFQYFKSCLTGEAHDPIKDLDITEENYDIAWNLVEQNYNNPRLILRRHCTILLDMYKNKDSSRTLLSIVNAVRSQLRPLDSLANKEEQYNAFLITIILRVPSDEVIYEWERDLVDNKMPNVNELLDFLQRRGLCVKSTESARTVRAKEVVEKSNSKGNSKKKKSQSSATSATNSAAVQKSTPVTQVFHANVQRKCPVCQSDHNIYQCPKFQEMEQQQRYKFALNDNRCLNCLGKGHGYNTCASGKCSICGKKHHTMLHRHSGGGTSTSADPEVLQTASNPQGISN